VEGIEGVGKSTHVQWIANIIRQKGREAIVTREPGGTPMAEDIRKILLATYYEATLPETELLLLYAGRLQHVAQVIRPALASQKWVICDRFTDATFAYQGAGRGISQEKINDLNTWALGSFSPDYTIILDAPVDIALSRIAQDRQLDRFEKEKKDFFERIRTFYLAKAEKNPAHYAIVDTKGSIAEVQAALQHVIEKMMTKEIA